MQRGQWRLCTRRKPPIYGQTLLHITLTTSREKVEWSESQPLQPSRCCRNPWKAKPVRFSRICRYIRDAVKLRGPFFFFCLFRPLDGCCRILESNSPVRLRLFCSFLNLKEFCTAGSRFRVSHSALWRQLQVATYRIRADWAFPLHRTQLRVKGQSRCFPLCMYFTTYKEAQQYPDLETTHTTEVKKNNNNKKTKNGKGM